VDHEQAGRAPGVEQRLVRVDGGPEQRDVVAQQFAEASRLEKVALHVDDDESGVIEVDHQRAWLGLNPSDAHDTRSC